MLRNFPKRIFIFGAALFVLVTLLILLNTLYNMRKEMINEAEEHAKAIARHINFEMFENYDFDMDKPWEKSGTDDFNEYILHGIKTLGLESIKIYNKDGVIIYSDDERFVGIKVKDNENFIKALNNEPASFITTSEYYKKVYGIEAKMDFVETYIPIYDENDGSIIGVFEIYQDFGALSKVINNAMKRTASVIIVLMLCFSVILFIVVRRGNMIILSEKERLVKGLEDAVGHRTVELTESERRSRTFLNNVTDAVLVLDKDGNFVSVNNKALEMTGYTRDELHTRKFIDIIDDDSKGRVLQKCEAALKGDDVSCEVKFRKKSGDPMPVEVRGKRIDYDGAQMIMAVGRDITERKRMEEIQSDFYSMLTHDFRVPLTPILGFINILLDKKDDSIGDDSRDMLEVIEKNAIKLNKLIDDFLLSSTIESESVELETHSFSLNHLINEVLVNHEANIKSKEINLIKELAPDPLVIKGDSHYIERAVSNLVNNAIKYNERGGVLKVTTTMYEDYKGGSVAKVDIFNSHGFIDKGDLAYVFGKYQRANSFRKIQGTGLGLYIAKSIVNLHGGDISVSSEKGVGTTFSFILPFHYPEMKAVS